MTEIQFHFNVPDRLGYACRLLRKAVRAGSKVAVTGPAATLARFDRELWTFYAESFVPHAMVPKEGPPAHLRDTPVWLVERAETAVHLPVLMHLGDAPAVGFESFERLLEVVSVGDDERQAGRARWQHYAGRGYKIAKHEVTT